MATLTTTDPLDEELRLLLLRERIERLRELGIEHCEEPDRLVHLLRCGAEEFLEPVGHGKFEIRYEITARSPANAEARARAWRIPAPEPQSWPDIGAGMRLIVFDREPPRPARPEARALSRGEANNEPDGTDVRESHARQGPIQEGTDAE